MTFALPRLRLRLPLVAGATVLLHYLALGWVSQGMGLPLDGAMPEQQLIVAQLRAPAPPPPAEAAPPPAPPRAPRKAAPPAPAANRVPEAAPPVQQPQEEPVLAATQPEAPEEAPVDQPAPEAAPAPVPVAPDIRANVPPSSELALELERIDAKGTQWHGVGQMSWEAGGGAYAMKFDAGISMVFTKVNLLALASEGSIGDGGFAPRLATEKRRGRAATATHFNREQGSITFSASQDAAALAPGAQDKATLPLQLAAIARADPAQFEGGLEITVGEERAASVYKFIVVGNEEIETKLGRLYTLHLSRPPKPGSYNSRLDVWLAPAHGWYPVRIRNTEASGAVTTQTVTQIVVTGAGTAHAK